MTIVDVSRELLAQELRELLPSMLVGGALTASVLFGYVIGRVQMARKYSTRNMPDHAKRHINYLALKLRIAEVERDKLSSENAKMIVRLRGVSAFVLPQTFVTSDAKSNSKTAVRTVHSRTRNSTKKLKLVKT